MQKRIRMIVSPISYQPLTLENTSFSDYFKGALPRQDFVDMVDCVESNLAS